MINVFRPRVFLPLLFHVGAFRGVDTVGNTWRSVDGFYVPGSKMRQDWIPANVHDVFAACALSRDGWWPPLIAGIWLTSQASSVLVLED